MLYEEVNPAFGAYNMTFMSPIESAPGGMIFYVQAVDLENGSTFTNPNYNSIRLILDGNSPLVLRQRRWTGRNATQVLQVQDNPSPSSFRIPSTHLGS